MNQKVLKTLEYYKIIALLDRLDHGCLSAAASHEVDFYSMIAVEQGYVEALERLLFGI